MLKLQKIVSSLTPSLLATEPTREDLFPLRAFHNGHPERKTTLSPYSDSSCWFRSISLILDLFFFFFFFATGRSGSLNLLFSNSSANGRHGSASYVFWRVL